MQSFGMGRFGSFGSSDDPWFRVGKIDVDTTTFLSGLSVVFMFIWAAEGPGRVISKWFWLVSRDFGFTGGSVLGGQLWRLVTWPIAYGPGPYGVDLFSVIVLVIFFLLGSQLEAAMGRRQYTIYLLLMTVIPAVLVTVYEAVTGTNGLITGLRDLEFGVFVGFAVRYPTARFWPGIPAWIMAAVFIGIEFLRDVGNRDDHSLIVLFAIVGTSALALRALGFAEEADWIPKLPLPAALTGVTPQRAASTGGARSSTSKRKKRGRGKLTAVPSPPVNAPRRELTKLEEAEMDAILDQVSEHGMDSLTSEQRSRLEEHSKRLRRRGD